MADFNIQVGAVVKDTLQKQLDGFTQKTVTVKPILDTKGVPTNVTKTVTDWTNAQGDSIKTTEKFNKVTSESSTVVSQYKKNCKSSTDAVNENSKAMKTNSTSMDKTTDSSKKLGQSMLDIATKVAKFYVVTKAIQTVQRAMGEAVEMVKNMDSVMTDFRKVSDLSGESLQRYISDLSDLGTTVGRTGSEMLASATQFKQSGYSDEDSANLAKISEMYRNVADSEISSAEASSFLISQMKAFKISSKDSIDILNSLNAISNDFAVSSSDVAEGMSKSSASMATYGNTMGESMSLVTAGSEVMVHQASRVSRGVVSIGANLVKLANSAGELKYTMDGATKSIKLFDDAGELKSTYKVLSEVADGWDKMSTAEQSSLAISLAG